MILNFKITSSLADEIKRDLRRHHAFAHERVGWISAGIARSGDDLIATARDYMPVADEDYIRDSSVGAMMNSNAIRSALEWSLKTRSSIFHVHEHYHFGHPDFSPTDDKESAKFVPDFFHVRPERPHGAIVFSRNSAVGYWWREEDGRRIPISMFVEVGTQLKKIGARGWLG